MTLKQLRFALKHRPNFQEHLPFIKLTDPNAPKLSDTGDIDDENANGSCLTRLITDEMFIYKMNMRE